MLAMQNSLSPLLLQVSRRGAQEMARDVDVRGSLVGQVDLDGFVQIVSKLQGSSYDHHEEIMQVCIIIIYACTTHTLYRVYTMEQVCGLY